MTQNQPLVSIGLPIYNAEHLIRRAIDTLLAQDYVNFELIISDNVSTDNTWNICQEYQAKDARIRLYRNLTNIGANANFERVLSLATAEYFMWAAHDDWWEPTFLSKCVARLEANPQSVLCHVRHVEPDEASRRFEATDYPNDLESHSRWKRIYSLLAVWPWPMPNVYVYGLFRRDMLNRIMPLANMIANDTILLLKAAQLGPIVGVEEHLHHYSPGLTGRGLRVYIQQIAPNTSPFSALTWDWRLFFILLKLSQTDAPTIKARLQGAWASGRLVNYYTGWPLSIKMVLNYLYILMPESLAIRLQRWLQNHKRIEKFLMRLVNKPKALAEK